MKLPGEKSLLTEIVVVLLVKTGFIFLIWWTFFSAPVDDGLDGDAVGSQLLGQLNQAIEEP